MKTLLDLKELQRRRGWSNGTVLHFLLQHADLDCCVAILECAAEAEDAARAKITVKHSADSNYMKEFSKDLFTLATIPSPREAKLHEDVTRLREELKTGREEDDR